MLALKPVEFVVSRLPDTDKAKAKAIMKYPLGHVRERVLKEGELSETIVDVAIEEYRKFMVLLALGNRNLAMCSKEVDEIWHNHILFTRDYAQFCQSIFGSFVHHMPATSAQPVSQASVDRFYSAYETIFGQVSPIWNAQYFPCLLKGACGGIPQGCGDCGGTCVSEEQKKADK